MDGVGARRYQDLEAWRLSNELKLEVYALTEFGRYVRIARASLIETQNHVRDGADRRYWPEHDATRVHEFADRAIGATTRLLRYLTSTPTPGE